MKRTSLVAVLGIVLCGAPGQEAHGEFRAYSCAEVLAASEAAELAAEAAIADAWGAVVSDELTASPRAELLFDALAGLDFASSPFLLPGSDEGSAFGEALEQLERVVDELVGSGRVDEVLLLELIGERAEELAGEAGKRRANGQEGRRLRDEPADPVTKIRVGERLIGTPVSLAGGRIAVATDDELVILDLGGRELSRTRVSSSISGGALAATDGEAAVVTADGVLHWIDASGIEVGTVPTNLRGFIHVLPLRDGRFALSAHESPVFVVSRDGTVRKISERREGARPLLEMSEGRLLLAAAHGELILVSANGRRNRRQIDVGTEHGIYSALLLRNGNVFVKSTSGVVFLFDSRGELLFKEQIGGLGVGAPAELEDGGIAFGGASWGMVFLNSDGSIRTRTEMEGQAMASTVVLSNGITVIGGEDARLHFYEADGRESGSIDVGPFVSRYDGILDGMLEVRAAAGRVTGYIGMLNGILLKIDLDALVEKFRFSRDFNGNDVL